MNTGEIGRPTLLGMAEWEIVLFYTLALCSLVVCIGGFVLLWRKYRRGRDVMRAHPRIGEFVRRIMRAMGSLTIMRDDPAAGVAHATVFTGFSLLFLGTLIVLVDRDIFHFVLPSLVFWNNDFYLGFSLVMDIAGLILISGVLWLTIRRAFFRSEQFDTNHAWRKNDSRVGMRIADWGFPMLLLAIVISGMLLEGVRLVIERPAFETWSPVGWWVADLLENAGLESPEASGWYSPVWWLHSIASLSFVALLPYSKAVHIILGAFSIAVYDPSLVRNLPPSWGEAGEGYSRIEDFTRTELLSLDACIRCGRCHALCPAAQSGLPLSPRDFILDMRTHLERPFTVKSSILRKRNGTDGNGSQSTTVTGRQSKHEDKTRSLAGDVIPEKTLWSCITCAQCVEHCPMGLNHIPLVVQLRRSLMLEGKVDEELQQTLVNLQRTGNAMGKSERMRSRWTDGLPFPLRDARKEEVEYLWFLGDNASFDPRVQDATRATAILFHKAGLDFGIVYESERNAGNDVRRIGEEGLFEMLMEKNLRIIEKCRFSKIVTTDPHTLNTLRNEYTPTMPFTVFHSTEILRELFDNGLLPRCFDTNGRVTYHDPCYLGRYNNITDAPRALLEATGYSIVEMRRSRRDGWCCGAGGGRLWMEDIPCDGERPAEQRLREAAALPDVHTLVTACPKDLVMFADALKTTGLEMSFAVRDIASMVLQVVGETENELSVKEY
ncbi:MAG: heterodisulfide reductase-related iron-sulfur binding cluster [Bacteroidia bacterium]|nr:heterodisulfide reductase-related iron-sulfur binding cluster [Bacteroidia bacterium]